MSIYDKLNEPQREAVYHTDGPLLILAAAGSGNTRVLTHRIAYLIEEKGINPWNILAITFTNKAAGEMRERVDNLVGFGSESIWVSTFHSMCVRILRRHIDLLGFDTNFTIYDTDDQKTLMKDICKLLQIDTKLFRERSLLAAISQAKNELVTPEEFRIQAQGDFSRQKIASVYEEYEKQMRANNALDFDDLLVKAVQLFQTQADVLDYYQERFRYIMVDEYQDTNTVQFELVRLLSAKYRNLCVVGDDDQSIYRFRGAKPEIMLHFKDDYPEAETVLLDVNYRSVKNIVTSAGYLIGHNKERFQKKIEAADQGDILPHQLTDPRFQGRSGKILCPRNADVHAGAQRAGHFCRCLRPQLPHGKENRELRRADIALLARRVGVAEQADFAVGRRHRPAHGLAVGLRLLLPHGNII